MVEMPFDVANSLGVVKFTWLRRKDKVEDKRKLAIEGRVVFVDFGIVCKTRIYVGMRW